MTNSAAPPNKSWPDYSAVWRWHFYAGLLCIPFILWLSITGSIYLFKPQVEAWLDAPYDHLPLGAHRASAEAQVRAALAAVPGARLSAYELPQTPQAATHILVGRDKELYRVYMNPVSLRVLKIVNEDDRFMKQISFLHGELAIGDRGSMIVELAACWAIIMILTGMFLWWPRTLTGLGGVLLPRLRSGARLFWRDLHAVTGIWICVFALFLLLTGLPWAKNWGGYLKEIRVVTGTAEGAQDWTVGRASEIAQRMEMNMPDASGAHGDHMGMASAPGAAQADAAALDRIIPVVAGLHLAPPVLISPPHHGAPRWTAKSDAQNRTRRATVELDAQGAILGRRDFSQRHPIDQAIGIGVSTHEGQLFGWPNQLISLATALGLVALSFSAVVLWLRRRPNDALGAPAQSSRPRFSWAMLASIVILAVLFPLFGASLIIVQALERLVLRRIPPACAWLGLEPAAYPK